MLSPQVLNKLEDMGLTAERLYDMEAGEIGAIIRHPAAGADVRGCLDCLPSLSMEAQLQPITRLRLAVQRWQNLITKGCSSFRVLQSGSVHSP